MHRMFTHPRIGLFFAAVGLAGALGTFYAAGQWSPGGAQGTKPVPSITHAHAGNHLHGIAYVPDAGLYLASHYGLFLLRDGRLFQVGGSRDDFMGFSRHPKEPAIFFSSGHPQTGGNLGVLVTRDGGMRWQRIFSGVGSEVVDFHAMAVSPAAPERLYGVFDRRFYVGNLAAKEWRLAAAKGIELEGFCWGVPCLAAAADNPDRVFAATPEGVFVTADAGESWRLLNSEVGAVAAIGAHPSRPDILMAFTQAHGAALSEDGGKSWAPRNEGLALAGKDFIFGFAFDPATPARVFAASVQGHVFESRDLATSWRTILTPEGPRS
jgi:photosystem II stability/assembly factor-like uncharacterized protein